jgi:hypothetical protein
MLDVTLANVIWPTFLTPWVYAAFMPWVGIWIVASEAITAAVLHRGARWKQWALWVLVANAISSVLGAIAGVVFSFVPGDANNLESDRAYLWVVLSFVLAFIVSVLVEFGVYRERRQRLFSSSPLRTSLICNAVSYAGIVAGLLAR